MSPARRSLRGTSQRAPHPRLGELARWMVAACGAAVITFALFGTMIGFVDGQWILEKLFRVFPLSEKPVGEHDISALDPARNSITLRFEGTVGRIVEDRFVPLEDVEIVGSRSSGGERRIEVGPGGDFRFEATFRDERAATPATTQIVIRSPGCSERRVPVTRAWLLPRRIALDCG